MEEFTSDENKALLWNLLYEGGVFHGITGDKVSEVRGALDNIVTETWRKKAEGEGLTELNKRACQMMLVAAERMRGDAPFRGDAPTQGDAPTRGDAPAVGSEASSLVTAAERAEHRRAEFADAFSKRQNEFSSLINGSPPAAIDFADRTEEPLEELDDALQRLQESRSRELGRTLGEHQEPMVPPWGDAPAVPKRLQIEESAVVAPPDVQVVGEKKQVRFESRPYASEASGFMSKLKVLGPPQGASGERGAGEKAAGDGAQHEAPHEPPCSIDERLDAVEKRLNAVARGQKTIIAMLSQLVVLE
jgi:hypothetical protein